MSEPVIPACYHRVAADDKVLGTDKVWDERQQEWCLADYFKPDPNTYLPITGQIAGFWTVIRLDAAVVPVPEFDWNAAATDFIVMGFAAAEADPSETWFDEKALEAAQPRVQAKVATVISVLQAWLAKHKPPTV